MLHPAEQDTEERARQAALDTGSLDPPPGPAYVSYESRGAVLIAGAAASALAAGEALLDVLRVVVLADGLTRGFRSPRRMQVVPGRLTAVSGYLGRFSVSAAGLEGPLNLGPLSPNRDELFDLVLDLHPTPSLQAEVQPLGYFAPGDDAASIAAAIKALGRLVGTVQKPRYVRYEPDLCVHGRQGVRGCDRCLSVCPAAAIRSGANAVEVDYYLCQGCGGCAAVCPTGAVSYADPPFEYLTKRLRYMLETYRGVGGVRPKILLHDPTPAPGQLMEAQGVLPFPVHSVAATGPETWLACLAWGAVEVLLAPSGKVPAGTRSLLETQVKLAGRLLDGVGQEPARLRLLNETETDATPRGPDFRELPFLDVAPDGDRRKLLLAAVAALRNGEASEQNITLPAGAAFGAVAVDEAACTLCFACANLCPSRALRRDQGGRPILLFTEAACVQCGICAHACPEGAIRLAPGLLLNNARRESARPLAEGEMAHCAECGKPYLPRTVLAAALSHVGTNSRLQADTGRLLELCPACRAERITHTEFRPAIPGRKTEQGP